MGREAAGVLDLIVDLIEHDLALDNRALTSYGRWVSKNVCESKLPCAVCKSFTKIPLPCGRWICPKTIFGAADHAALSP